MLKNKKGITLVALVVTIVVLLILAGVSINLVLGDNGIVKKAQEAKEKSTQASQNDLAAMDELAQQLENALNGSSSGSGNGGSGSGTETKVPAATTETAPYFPDNTFTKKEGTIDTGLVIQDSDRNEYVWVVVPRTLYDNTDYNSDGAKKPSSSTDYENIEYCLQQYTSTYRNETSALDTWDADTINEGWLTSDEYTELKNNMLKSVYENGGFYVGRYEAGIETTGTNRTNNTDMNSDGKYVKPTTAPVTKADAYPYTYVTRTQAQKLAESLSNGKSYTSSLMFGVQWDLVLAFMAKDKTKITSTTVLTSNSTSIGNYNDNLWKITNTKAQYSSDYGSTFTACPNPFKKESSSSILLTTGADSSFSVQNIYDIAGNVWEWTLENTSDTNGPCARRGSGYGNIGSGSPASGRTGKNTTYNKSDVGFRVSLF